MSDSLDGLFHTNLFPLEIFPPPVFWGVLQRRVTDGRGVRATLREVTTGAQRATPGGGGMMTDRKPAGRWLRGSWCRSVPTGTTNCKPPLLLLLLPTITDSQESMVHAPIFYERGVYKRGDTLNHEHKQRGKSLDGGLGSQGFIFSWRRP